MKDPEQEQSRRVVGLTSSIPPSKIIINGGLEEGILEAVNQDGLLSEKDKQRLEELKSLPRNRYEFERNGKKFYRDLDPKEPIEIK